MVARLRQLTGGVGVDVVLEMSGAEVAIRQGFEAVTNGGRVSLLGIPERPITLDLASEVIFKGIRVYGITGRKMFETWYRTQALLAQGLDLTPDRDPPNRHSRDYDQAFDLLAGGHAGKVVLLAAGGLTCAAVNAHRPARIPGRRPGRPARQAPLPTRCG